MRKIPLDAKVGLFIFAFFTFVLLVIVPNQIKIEMQVASSPRLYPQLLIGIIIFLSVLMIVKPIIKEKKLIIKESGSKPTAIITAPRIRVFIVILAFITYIWVIRWLGFLLSSGITLAFLMRFYGYRNKLIIILLAVLLPLVTYYVFQTTLNVVLPTGNIFE